MTRRNSGYRALAETGVCAALCVVFYVAGASLPGVGQYLKFVCPGVMGIICQRYGIRQAAMLATVSSVLVGLLVGFREFFVFALLLTPVGLALPELHWRGFSWKKVGYWLVYAVCFTALVFILSRLMGLTLPEFINQMATMHYGMYGRFYAKARISQEAFASAVQTSTWLLLPVLALAYGTMLTLINRLVLAKGSALLPK